MRMSDWSSDVCSSDLQLDGFRDSRQKILPQAGLGEEIDRSGLHRQDAGRKIAMSRQKDDRPPTGGELLLQPQAAHPRHHKVKDDAAVAPCLVILKEAFRSEEHTYEIKNLKSNSY